MNHSTMPTLAITVLMSCYNAARWLEEAINSVLNQSFKEFEFIIIDDGSNDDTLKIIQQFAARDHRIVVIAKPNTGLADSLNIGLAKARGEWIARLDADDICTPDRLKQQYAYARTGQGIVFVGSGLTIIDEYGDALKTHHYPLQHAFLLKRLRTLQPFPAHSSAFYLTSAARKINGYRPRITRAEDLDLWLRLSEMGELACINAPLISLRKHADQISHDDSGKQQLICAYMAVISYFIRQYHATDPVDANDEQFAAFKNWLEVQLKINAIFNITDYRVQIKKSLSRSSNMMTVFVNTIYSIASNPHYTIRLIHQQLIGESLPKSLAKQWVGQ